MRLFKHFELRGHIVEFKLRANNERVRIRPQSCWLKRLARWAEGYFEEVSDLWKEGELLHNAVTEMPIPPRRLAHGLRPRRRAPRNIFATDPPPIASSIELVQPLLVRSW
jgi:hypothetical protein